MAVNTDQLVCDIIEWLAERHPGDRPELASFRLASGKRVPLDLPVQRPAARARESATAATEEERLPRYWYDIVDVLEEAGEPLKREAIVKRLKASGREHGESTIYKAVPRMVERGWLRSTPDGFVPGIPTE